MLHTESHGHQPSGSGEDFERVFPIYASGGYLGHVTTHFFLHLANLSYILHMKFEFNWSSGF